MAKHGIGRELYNRLVAEGKITEAPRRRPKLAALGERTPAGPALALPVRFHLPMPPSTNKLWSTVKDKHNGAIIRVLTREARQWRQNAQLYMPKGAMPAEPVALQVALVVFTRCYHADGTARQLDVTNRVKFLEDCIAAALHYDDRRHWRVIAEKRDAKQEGVAVEITAFEGGNLFK